MPHITSPSAGLRLFRQRVARSAGGGPPYKTPCTWPHNEESSGNPASRSRWVCGPSRDRQRDTCRRRCIRVSAGNGASSRRGAHSSKNYTRRKTRRPQNADTQHRAKRRTSTNNLNPHVRGYLTLRFSKPQRFIELTNFEMRKTPQNRQNGFARRTKTPEDVHRLGRWVDYADGSFGTNKNK
jgi:hypothetical protein